MIGAVKAPLRICPFLITHWRGGRLHMQYPPLVVREFFCVFPASAWQREFANLVFFASDKWSKADPACTTLEGFPCRKQFLVFSEVARVGSCNLRTRWVGGSFADRTARLVRQQSARVAGLESRWICLWHRCSIPALVWLQELPSRHTMRRVRKITKLLPIKRSRLCLLR